MRLAVLIPARDEAPRIGAVIAGVHEALPGAPVFVVNSGSQDETAAVSERAGARVLEQGGAGYAGALATGFCHLAAADYGGLVLLDADGQHPPAEAPRLVAALAGANLAFGSRSGQHSGGSLARRLGNAALSAAVYAACGARLGDVTCGFQAIDRQALRLFAERFPERVADANVRVYAVRAGLRCVEVPVTVASRGGGVSMHAGWRGLRNLGASLGAVWEEARLSPSELRESVLRSERETPK